MPDEDLDVKSGEESSSDASGEKQTASPAAPAKTLADVVKETAAAAASSATPAEKVEEEAAEVTETAPETKDASESEEKAEEEPKLDDKDKALPFNSHPRFRELVKERNEFKQKTEQAEPALKRDAALAKYCQENSISNEEFISAMEVAALLHNDPKKALDTLRNYVETLELTLGNKLPTDLQKEVDDGAISEARAKELASLRVKAQGLEYTGKKTEAQVVQERQQVITNAVNSWDQSKRSSDPSYDKKYPLIEKTFVALCMSNPPQSAAAAIQLAEKAYAEVNTALGTLVPKPPQRKVLKSNGAASKGALDIKAGTSLRDALPQIARQVAASHRE